MARATSAGDRSRARKARLRFCDPRPLFAAIFAATACVVPEGTPLDAQAQDARAQDTGADSGITDALAPVDTGASVDVRVQTDGAGGADAVDVRDAGGDATDGASAADACELAGAASDDVSAFDAIVRCAGDVSRSDTVVRGAIARFVSAVEGRGGFPIIGGGSVRFVYVREAQYDVEDDRSSTSEDFSLERRAEPITVAGDFNAWNERSLAMRAVGRGLFVATHAAEPTAASRWGYKFVARDGAATTVYFSDPLSRRFQYDTNGRISFVRGGSSAGHLEWIRSVRATRLMNERPIFLYVPPGYDQRASDRFSVLYLHDGNNAFDVAQPRSAPASWDVDAASDAEILAGRASPFIIVAIPNNDARMNEYTHTTDVISGMRLGGRGDDYVDYIVSDVKPTVDRRYRTRASRESTAIIGSSLGGLISFHAGLRRPDVFSMVGGMSSTFEWGGFGGGTDTMLARFGATAGLSGRAQRFYLDSGGGPAGDGTCTFDGVDDPRDNYCETLEMRRILVAAGINTFPLEPDAPVLSPRDANIYHWYERGAPHSETAWRQRFFRAVRFFFAP
jgi:hypothetical protein